MTAPATLPQTPAPAALPPDVVLDVRDLYVRFETKLGTVQAVNGVSLTVPRRRVLGVVGESGCGKSITAFAVMQLVPPPGRITGGAITLRTREGRSVDVLALDRSSEAMREIRGRHVGMIFQEPMTALNPCYTIGNQIVEGILVHQTRDRKEAE